MVMAVGGRIRLMRAPDILLFMQMAGDIATCVYHTGLDPFTGEEVSIAKHLRDRKLQRALLQFFKPENYFEVRRAVPATVLIASQAGAGRGKPGFHNLKRHLAE